MGESDRQNPVQGGENPAQSAINPLCLPMPAAAKVLGLPEATITRHVAEGAPTNADGSLNLVHYVAWLNQRLKERDPQTDGTEV